jgi:hypothetical protein
MILLLFLFSVAVLELILAMMVKARTPDPIPG